MKRIQEGASGACYLKVSLIRIKEGASGASLRSAPSAPGYLEGALMLTFHTAMKSWQNRSARSAEKIEQKKREATGGHGNGAEIEATRNQQEAKQREATGGQESHGNGTEIVAMGNLSLNKARTP